MLLKGENMKESFFQFQDPVLLNMNYNENVNFNIQEFDNMKMNFKVSVDQKNESSAFVSLTLEIGDKDNNPFYIEIEMGSLFTWIDNVEEKSINELLRINAPVLLTGYIRPIVALITSTSRFPTFNLPFIDFT
jgi:preprotein translocase subunit SecB